VNEKTDYMPLIVGNDSPKNMNHINVDFLSNQKENSDDYIINPLLALQRQQSERANIHFMDEQQI
jgi:hypothetical protein